jgi:phosphoglycerate dehydrogenase-like enzyme
MWVSNIEIVAVSALSEEDKRRIEAIDPRVRVTNASDWFDGEIAATWPARTASQYKEKPGTPPKAERDAVLAKAEIITHSFPYPLDMRARSPSLKWAHQRNAGANNLWRGDLWKSDVMVTTTRAEVAPYPIAEYAVAGLLHAARDFNQASADARTGTFDRAAYKPVMLAGRTVCIVGAGGIGQIAGKLLAGLGMKVVGVRHSMRVGEALPEGFSDMRGRDGLLEMLARSDAAVIACQLTKDTENMMNAAAFAVMRPGSLIVNVARGEVVDETALLDALDAGQIKGAVLDVYANEHDGPPPARLWTHPGVLITPHNSPRAGAGGPGPGMGIRIFCENLRAYIDGKPLTNVVDWDRGY